MRVVFDTNILVLSFLGDPATSIVRAALTTESLAFFYSPATLAEYRNALEEASTDRPAPFRGPRIAALLADVEARGRLIHPAVTLTRDDPDACSHDPDNRFLECAIAAAAPDEANYIVTVNTRHFPERYQTPSAMIEVVGPGQLYRTIFSG